MKTKSNKLSEKENVTLNTFDDLKKNKRIINAYERKRFNEKKRKLNHK